MSQELEVARARARTRRFARWHGITGGRREDLVMVVSELVTNAIMHGGGLRKLRLMWRGAIVVISVEDYGPRPGEPDPEAEGGRGLVVVRELAQKVRFTVTAQCRAYW